MRAQLTMALGSTHTIVEAADWSDLQTAVRHGPIDVVVADPATLGEQGIDVLHRMRAEFPSVPVIVYTALTPESIRAVLRLARMGIHEVVFARIDDRPQRLRELVETLPSYTLAERMVDDLADVLANLPVSVQRAVDTLFRTPGRFKNAQ